jgi:hypothetical protein
MALELQLIKHHSGILIPATPETSDILQSKTRLGDVLVAEFRRARNPDYVTWTVSAFLPTSNTPARPDSRWRNRMWG